MTHFSSLNSGYKYESGRNSDYMFYMYDYCESHTPWPRGLYVAVSISKTHVDSWMGSYYSGGFLHFLSFHASELEVLSK